MERWLGLVERTLAVDPAAAREVVATAALVRGYADTYKRGLANWTRIMDGVVEPMLAGRLPRAHFADAVLQARLAASKDPEGEALGRDHRRHRPRRRPRQDRRGVGVGAARTRQYLRASACSAPNPRARSSGGRLSPFLLDQFESMSIRARQALIGIYAQRCRRHPTPAIAVSA